MKKSIITLVAVIAILSANAQKSDSLKKLAADTTIFTTAEMQPEFPGGNDNFLKFIGKNIRYPSDARRVNKQGKVIVQFIIEKDGSVTNVKVLRPLFPSIDSEAIRVVSSSAKWKPGMQKGQGVRVSYVVPITFNIDNHVYFNLH